MRMMIELAASPAHGAPWPCISMPPSFIEPSPGALSLSLSLSLPLCLFPLSLSPSPSPSPSPSVGELTAAEAPQHPLWVTASSFIRGCVSGEFRARRGQNSPVTPVRKLCRPGRLGSPGFSSSPADQVTSRATGSQPALAPEGRCRGQGPSS